MIKSPDADSVASDGLAILAQVYPGGETELEALLGRIDRGEPITI